VQHLSGIDYVFLGGCLIGLMATRTRAHFHRHSDGLRAPPIPGSIAQSRADSFIRSLQESRVLLRLRILQTGVTRFHIEYRGDPRIEAR
jgi:hypothetical protein